MACVHFYNKIIKFLESLTALFIILDLSVETSI